ncbi:hypothetical protein MAR_017793 [Mya arenaria]|uniref:Uncharacterized protein n=1 Tax=Mya arenaria TaxID=6604 RepID=A0ABY7ECU6_MYAAR|nr:hypothetical protein MAR_017793 [Mya arenaria]
MTSCNLHSIFRGLCTWLFFFCDRGDNNVAVYVCGILTRKYTLDVNQDVFSDFPRFISARTYDSVKNQRDFWKHKNGRFGTKCYCGTSEKRHCQSLESPAVMPHNSVTKPEIKIPVSARDPEEGDLQQVPEPTPVVPKTTPSHTTLTDKKPEVDEPIEEDQSSPTAATPNPLKVSVHWGPSSYTPSGPLSKSPMVHPLISRGQSSNTPCEPLSDSPCRPLSDTPSGPSSDTPSGPLSDTFSGPSSDSFSGLMSETLSGPLSDTSSGPLSDSPSGQFSDTPVLHGLIPSVVHRLIPSVVHHLIASVVLYLKLSVVHCLIASVVHRLIASVVHRLIPPVVHHLIASVVHHLIASVAHHVQPITDTASKTVLPKSGKIHKTAVNHWRRTTKSTSSVYMRSFDSMW